MKLLTFSGVICQLAALSMLLEANTSLPVLLGFAGLQALASGLLALVLWRLLPTNFRTPFKWSYSYLALLCFCIPLGGALICFGSLALARLFPPQSSRDGIALMSLPTISGHLITHNSGRLRSQLNNPKVAVSKRMTALVALQPTPGRTSSPIFRNLLADGSDDIRLLAYGMLDRAEKHLTQQILAQLPRLESAKSPAKRRKIHRRLASLYWELIYQNLVQGDVYHYTAEQVEHHARAALEDKDNDPALWHIRGRLALTRHEPARAREFLQRAQSLGFANERVLPLLAEAAYLERDYAQVQRLMMSFNSPAPLPLVRPLLRYWQS